MNKLKGKNQIDRMREMMNVITPGSSTPKTTLKESVAPNGKKYGVIKENSNYYVMESTKNGYLHINGRRNKKDYEHKSYSGALKQMNLLFSSLNEVYQNVEEGINLFEEKKYVVRVKKNEQASPEMPSAENKPKAGRPGLVKRNGEPSTPEKPKPPTQAVVQKTAPPAPEPTTPPAPPVQKTPPTPPMPKGPTSTDDVTAPSAGSLDFDSEVASIERELGGGEESPEKEIQSLTGKLGQALRQGEQEEVVDTELTKYVVNSVFSALNLGELTDEDKLDIIRKVKNAGTEGEMPGTPDMPEPMGMEPEEEMDSEMEVDGLDTGMEDELDLTGFEDFEDEVEMDEDVLYGDQAEDSREDNITGALKSFVEKTVDSYLNDK